MLDTMRLTKGDLLDLVGMTPKVYENWVQKGVIVPDGDDCGFRTYKFETVLGIAVAHKLHNSEIGCALSYCKDVIAAFGKTTVARIEGRFKAGAVRLEPTSHQNGLRLTGEGKGSPAYPNVKELYDDLSVRAFEMVSNRSEQGPGRRRGLAARPSVN